MLDKNGHEIPDPTPLSLPLHFKRPETLAEQVQRLVRTHVSAAAAAAGAETFEEAEDFDVGDDIDPTSPYEEHFDPILGKGITAEEFRQNEKVYRKRYLDAQKAYTDHIDLMSSLEDKPVAATAAPAGDPPQEKLSSAERSDK